MSVEIEAIEQTLKSFDQQTVRIGKKIVINPVDYNLNDISP